MSFVGDLFGLNGGGDRGGAGMSYQATAPTQSQLNDVWSNTQNGLGMQQAFINALAGQNGIANQSNVFNQQQALAGQLALQAAGGGPNPAQAQFQQNANQVAAQTAGLMGSQKGISPALQARLIAQQGAGAGQAAAGQAATLQAQQQLAAQQALAQQQANMANLSTQQVGQQQNAINSFQSGALGQQQNIYGMQGGATTANSGIARQTAGNQYGLFNSIGTGLMALAHGGQVPGFDMGGPVAAPLAPYSPMQQASGPRSAVGKSFMNQMTPSDSGQNSDPYGEKAFRQAIVDRLRGGGGGGGGSGMMAGGAGDAPLVQDSGLGFGAAPVMAAACGGPVPIKGEAYAHSMKPVPGKAKVKGDSQANDTVPARLSPGEIIIPRSIATHENAPELAAKFVAAVKAKQGRGIG